MGAGAAGARSLSGSPPATPARALPCPALLRSCRQRPWPRVPVSPCPHTRGLQRWHVLGTPRPRAEAGDGGSEGLAAAPLLGRARRPRGLLARAGRQPDLGGLAGPPLLGTRAPCVAAGPRAAARHNPPLFALPFPGQSRGWRGGRCHGAGRLWPCPIPVPLPWPGLAAAPQGLGQSVAPPEPGLRGHERLSRPSPARGAASNLLPLGGPPWPRPAPQHGPLRAVSCVLQHQGLTFIPTIIQGGCAGGSLLWGQVGLPAPKGLCHPASPRGQGDSTAVGVTTWGCTGQSWRG